jgi:hypothetical protein
VLDAALDNWKRPGRNCVLEAGEDADVLLRDQVGAGADYLAELDEKSLAADGDVVVALRGPAMMAAALLLGRGRVQVEPLLAERDQLVPPVHGGGEAAHGHESVQAVGEVHVFIMGLGWKNAPRRRESC